MIEVKHLSKSYGPHHAVSDISFTVNKGEVVGFLGPNGAGKTTTMKIITGYMAPTTGRVEVAGFNVFSDPLEVKRRIGYLPETPPVYGEMRVRDYLRFVSRLKGIRGPDVDRLVNRAIEKTNLGDVSQRLIQNLSKGFRQRVGIAQALVNDPEILILDEPTVGLDPKQVAEIRRLIKEIAGDHTIILSTHILPEVEASCQKVIIIHEGQIVAEDTLARLGERMSQGGIRVSIRVRQVKDGLVESLTSVPGVRQVQAGDVANSLEVDADVNDQVIDQLASQIISSGSGVQEIRSATVNLEKIFLQLTESSTSGGPQ
jgi:ABC-2 type transport system ATP-binding protein